MLFLPNCTLSCLELITHSCNKNHKELEDNLDPKHFKMLKVLNTNWITHVTDGYWDYPANPKAIYFLGL